MGWSAASFADNASTSIVPATDPPDNAATFAFTTPNMFTKPLFRPGVSDAATPHSFMKDASTLKISSGSAPDNPFTSKTTRPFVNCASESPWSVTVPSSSKDATTYTVERHPGTLLDSIWSVAGKEGASWAQCRSCLYLYLSSGRPAMAFTSVSSFAGLAAVAVACILICCRRLVGCGGA